MLTMLQGLVTRLAVMAVSAPTEDALNKAVTNSPFTQSDDIVKFYQDWGSHLHLSWGMFRKMAGWFQNVPVHWIYDFNKGFESIFNAMFNLLGWDGNLAAKGSPLHALYATMFAIGWALLGAALIVVVLQSIGHSVRWGKILPNVVMVALTLTVLPLMMQKVGSVGSGMPGVGNVAETARDDLNSASSKGMSDDLAIQPIKNNIIDLSTVVRKKWNVNPDRAESAKLNRINSDNDVDNLDLGEYLDATTLKDLGLDKDKFKDYTAPLKYHLMDESGQDDGGYIIVKNATGVGAGSNNDDVYARYDVDWIGLLGQSIILGVILLIASIRVVKDIFELTAMNLVAPVLAFQSVRDPKKMRDLVNSIIGLYLSMVLIVLMIKMFFIFIAEAPAKLPKMSWTTHALAIIVIYAGAGYAMMAGISYFERVTGVSQGFADEGGHAMAAGAMGGMMAGMGARAVGGGLSKVSSWGNSKSNGIFGSKNSSSSNSNNSSRGTAIGGPGEGHGINADGGGGSGTGINSDNSSHNSEANGSNTGINNNSQDTNNAGDTNENNAQVDNNQQNNQQNDQPGDTATGIGSGGDSVTEVNGDEGHGIGGGAGADGQPGENGMDINDPNAESGHGIETDPGTQDQFDQGADNPYDASETGNGISEPGVENGDVSNSPYDDAESGHGISDNPDVQDPFEDAGSTVDPYSNPETGNGISEPGTETAGDGLGSPYDNNAGGNGINSPEVNGGANGSEPGNTGIAGNVAGGGEMPGADNRVIGGAGDNPAQQASTSDGGINTNPSVNSGVGNAPSQSDAPVRPSMSERLNQAGKTLEKSSSNYLTSRRFNMAQRGHANGRESAPFEDEE